MERTFWRPSLLSPHGSTRGDDTLFGQGVPTLRAHLLPYSKASTLDSTQLQHALTRVALNYRWSWDHRIITLFSRLPGEPSRRPPLQVVASLSPGDLQALAADQDFVDGVAEAAQLLDEQGPPVHPVIAYCSPEFGLDATLPQYAGGLGVLAGDHLKTSSDLAVPLIGVGLFYREGVFRQSIENGRQVDHTHEVDPEAVGARDTGVVVEIPFPGRAVHARVREILVGRTRLLALDTNIPENHGSDRSITDRLYEGDRKHRLEQEMVLGIGGARALESLGLDIKLHHLNEGHAGFIALALIDRVIDGDLDRALQSVSRGLVFTTHTPVPAGIDRFDRQIVEPFLELWAERWGIDVAELWRLGVDPDHRDKFNMAVFCLRVSDAANGVSALHGAVSREMFAGIGIGSEIGHVSNGVHARTWTSPEVQSLLDVSLGPAWAEGDSSAWDGVDLIDDDEILSARRPSALRLAELVDQTTGHKLDPDSMVIGFARRFAPYKRATLLFREIERLRALLGNDDLPIHFLFAGKAHPADEPGNQLVEQVVGFAEDAGKTGRFTFVPDYDMRVAARMVQGCDVWMNNPIRRREASGTSGEKAVLNGGLNCSILDGWWAEMHDGHNGWAIPHSDSSDPETRDREEAGSLLDTLEAIRAEFHTGRPLLHGRIRHAWRTLGPRVTAARMLRDYERDVYQPALTRLSGGGTDI